MKYYYEKPDNWAGVGEIYICEHPMYNKCTLFRIGDRGLAIIQERFNKKNKFKWWSSIDPWIAYDLYFHPGFKEYFDQNAGPLNESGLYPTVTVRKIMWSLRMKPLRKEYWENDI